MPTCNTREFNFLPSCILTVLCHSNITASSPPFLSCTAVFLLTALSTAAHDFLLKLILISSKLTMKELTSLSAFIHFTGQPWNRLLVCIFSILWLTLPCFVSNNLQLFKRGVTEQFYNQNLWTLKGFYWSLHGVVHCGTFVYVILSFQFSLFFQTKNISLSSGSLRFLPYGDFLHACLTPLTT